MTLKLSPAMESVLTTAYRNATDPIIARTNTIVALIDRGLVTTGTHHYLTDDGLRAAERLLGLPISGHSVHVDDATYDPRDLITDEEAGADTWMIDQLNHDAVRAELEAEYAAELEAEYAAEQAEMAHAAREAEADAYHATMIESQDMPTYVNAGPAPVMSTGRGAWHGEHRKPMSVKSREAAKRRRKAQRQARKAQRRAGR